MVCVLRRTLAMQMRKETELPVFITENVLHWLQREHSMFNISLQCMIMDIIFIPVEKIFIQSNILTTQL